MCEVALGPVLCFLDHNLLNNGTGSLPLTASSSEGHPWAGDVCHEGLLNERMTSGVPIPLQCSARPPVSSEPLAPPPRGRGRCRVFPVVLTCLTLLDSAVLADSDGV